MKSNRGGKREGAGRKRGTDNTIQAGYRLKQSTIDLIKEKGAKRGLTDAKLIALAVKEL